MKLNPHQTSEIEIVIPLYNEAESIGENVHTLVDFLKTSNFPYPYTISLVNNASTDESLEICEGLAVLFPEVKVQNLKEKGKGRAIRKAWSESTADILAFMDADLSSDLKSFGPLIDAVVNGGYDMAIGNRLGKNSKVISRKNLRKVASHVYNILVRILFRTGIPDHQCGFKAVRQEAFSVIAPSLRADTWFLDTELIVWASKKGFKIFPIDIVWIDRKDSKVSITKTSWELFKAVLDLRRHI